MDSWQQAPSQAAKARRSRTFGILGLMFSCIPLVGLVLAIIAVVLGHQAKGRSGTEEGAATAGLVMGYIGIALTLLISLLIVPIVLSAVVFVLVQDLGSDADPELAMDESRDWILVQKVASGTQWGDYAIVTDAPLRYAVDGPAHAGSPLVDGGPIQAGSMEPASYVSLCAQSARPVQVGISRVDDGELVETFGFRSIAACT